MIGEVLAMAVPTDQHELANLTANGQPPRTRLTSASSARAMYERAREHNARRDERDAKVKGLVDGNPPYSQAKLKQSGQSYRSNFNNGEAESFLNTAITAFYDIYSETDHRASVEVPPEIPDSPRLSDIATEQFDWLVDQNDRLDYNIQLSIHNMVLYGRGPQIWENQYDWRSKAIGHSDLILPQNAKSNICEWEKCWIKQDYRVDELFQFIADEEAASAAGWNVEEVRQAIMKASEPAYPEGGNNWMRYQQWIRNNDVYAGEQAQLVRCAIMLYKEFSKGGEEGKISQAWVWLDGESEEFLFQETGLYDDWRNALNAFFYDRGDGYANGVRGLGVKMFSMLTAKQRLQNATVDAAMVRSALTFRALGSGAAAQNLSVVPVGPFMVVPNGFELMPVNNTQAIDAPLMVSRDLDGTLAANLGQYRARLEKPEGNPRTAFEVNVEIQKQSILGKTQIARYYQQLDEYWSEVFRRAVSDRIPTNTNNKWLRLALAFQRRCEERGVPIALLRKCRVTARRTVGQGSAHLRAMALGQLFAQLYPALPEDGKTNLVNDMIAANVGRHAVERYNPGMPMRNGEMEQRWVAQVENDTLRNRGQVTLTPQHNDVIHAQEHLAFASQAAASLQQGADMADIFSVLQAEGQHIAMHLQRLSTNTLREQEFKILEKQFRELAKLTDQLAQKLQEQQQAQAEQAQMAAQAQALQDGTDPELQLKQAEMQAKIGLKKQKQDADIALKLQKEQANREMANRKFAVDTAQKDAKVAQDLTVGAAKAAQDIKIKSEKAKATPKSNAS